MQQSQVIREATRRWKVCEHGSEATCQKTDPEVPRAWCDACVARALLEFTVSMSDEEPEPPRHYPRMVEAQRRRRAQEKAAAGEVR